MSDFTATECAIRQLHARYTDAVWRRDYDAFADCFTEDAQWRISGMVLDGRVEIVWNLKRLLPRFRRVLMTFRTPILSVADGAATGRTYVTEQSVLLDGTPAMTIGIYYERFVDQGDRWRCSWRLFQLHYMGAEDLSGPFFDNPDFGTPPDMPDLDAPTYNHSGFGVDKTKV